MRSLTTCSLVLGLWLALQACVPSAATPEAAAGPQTAAVTPPSPPAAPPQPMPTVRPEQLPLLEGSDLRYVGKFTLPDDDGAGGTLRYGGMALGMGADGTSLYFGCIYGTSAARVSIPAVGERATVIEPCRGLKNLNALLPNDGNGKSYGGVLAWNGRVVISGYAVYDAGGEVTASHFAGPTIEQAQGPFTVGKDRAGMVGGYMAIVPPEWRAAFGGPALTGQCCISIISRTSFGPTVSVFDPDHVGTRPKIPATMLVGYPNEHQNLGVYDVPNQYFSSAANMGGVAFPDGTRSVLFVGRLGSTYCYGEGTADRTLHGKPHPAGTLWCYDPGTDYKGPHGFPYKHVVWAYDANDLAAVKAGRKAPWDVRPYGLWTLTEMSGGLGHAEIHGTTYDPATRRLYITASVAPVVHVYEVARPPIPTP